MSEGTANRTPAQARTRGTWFGKKNNKAGVAKKGYVTTTPGIEYQTFTTGNANDAAKFTKSLEALQLYFTKECHEGALVAETLKTGQAVAVPMPALLPAPRDNKKFNFEVRVRPLAQAKSSPSSS